MFWDLAQRPAWVLGILTMLTGFMLHAVSISISQIALVQPLLIAELPFTLVLAALTFHLPVGKRDWAAIGMACLGLAAFVGALAPHGGSAYQVDHWTWAIAIAATLAGAGALIVLGYRGKDQHRAVFLGIATGAIFGLNSSLIAGVGASVAHGGSLFLTWQTYGVAIIAPTSFFLLQNALAAGNLIASQPGLTLTNPLVAVAYALVVFDEQTRRGIFLFAAVAGVLLIGAGTVLLAQSKLLQPDSSPTRKPPERTPADRVHARETSRRPSPPPDRAPPRLSPARGRTATQALGVAASRFRRHDGKGRSRRRPPEEVAP